MHNHYQKQGNSYRLKTVRNNQKTVRNAFPDGQPSGISRQEQLVRKGYYSLSDGRQETIPVGNSCRVRFDQSTPDFATETVRDCRQEK